ncbi:MAG: hypothetical protein K6T83_02220 [Alicyclobacillus sp.]|nr:hypothetical protein [Alicyclobacillus sp.]
MDRKGVGRPVGPSRRTGTEPVRRFFCVGIGEVQRIHRKRVVNDVKGVKG